MHRLLPGLDWALVERIARRHRVEGLVWAAVKNMAQIPPAAAASLSAAASTIARQNLQIAAESMRLKHVMEEAGIPLLFIKGLSLAVLAYDNILLKSGWDIDILVPPERIAEAAGLLEQAGYVVTVPQGAASAASVVAWHRKSKESVWRHSARGTHVELHSALTDHPMLLPGIDARSPRQDVPIAQGASLPTLATDELFAYLCVHGASSAWFRLKWIADLAAFLKDCPAAEVSRLYRRSRELGAGRAADVGLILCQGLFGTALDPPLVRKLSADRMNRFLVKAVERSLTGRAVATEVFDLRLGTFWIHLFQLGIVPGLRYKLTALAREARLFRRLLP